MSEFKIDKDIPIPGVHRSRFSATFHQLEVGDSVFFPSTDAPHRSLATVLGRTLGRKFSLRQRTENGVDGFRLWRTK